MTKGRTMRERVYRALSDESSRLFFPLNNTIAVIIIASTLTLILETVPSLKLEYGQLFIYAEYVFISLFAVEYALRLWSAPERLRYAFSFFGIIDLLAVLPGFFILASPTTVSYHALGVVRILRVLRLLRTFRLVHYIIPKERREQMTREMKNAAILLNLQIYFFALTCVVVLSGTLIYVLEGSLPHSPFDSIPHGMWWAVVTVTTVGYGDLVPETVMGRIVAAATMIIGLGLTALLFAVFGRLMHMMLFGAPLDDKVSR